jgi:5-methylcytosine-specific restriction protein B
LAEIFENAIIPLLQEYFYEDYEKIRMVLGDNQKKDTEQQFIIKTVNNYYELFGNVDDLDETYDYSINNNAFYNIEAYKNI